MNLIYGGSYTHFSINDKVGVPSQIYKSRVKRLGDPNHQGNRHLDYGCGSGAFVSAAIDFGWDSYGCDPFLLNELLEGELNGRLFKIGSKDEATKTVLGKFDIISLWAVAEHMTEISSVFSFLESLLNPGGRIIFNWPYGNSYAARRNGNKWSMSILVEHLTFATKKSVNHLADEMNMSVEELIICGSPYPFGLSSNPSLVDQGVSDIDVTHMDAGKIPSEVPVTNDRGLSSLGAVKYILGVLRSLLLDGRSNGVLANCARKIIQLARVGDHVQVILVKNE
jgi:SAM-dependent methyltransferase